MATKPPADNRAASIPSANFSRVIELQFDTIFRRLACGPAVQTTNESFVLITREPHPFGNFAIFRPTCDKDECTQIIASLVQCAAPSAVIFPSGIDTHIIDDAEAAGFALAETMPAMAVDINRLTPTAMPDHCTIEECDVRDDDDWCDAFAVGYGIPRPVASIFGPRAAKQMIADGSMHYYAVRKENLIIGTSTIFRDGDTLGVYCVSTLPNERGRGIAAHLTAEPLRRLRSDQHKTGILQSSAMGESVYRKLGFQQHGRLLVHVRIPPGMDFAH